LLFCESSKSSVFGDLRYSKEVGWLGEDCRVDCIIVPLIRGLQFNCPFVTNK